MWMLGMREEELHPGRLVCSDYKQGGIQADGVNSASKQVGSHVFFFGRQRDVFQRFFRRGFLWQEQLKGRRPKT